MKFNRYIEDDKVMLAYGDNNRKCSIFTTLYWMGKIFLTQTDWFWKLYLSYGIFGQGNDMWIYGARKRKTHTV